MRKLNFVSVLAILLLLGLLSSCGGKKEEVADTGKNIVVGQVTKGDIAQFTEFIGEIKPCEKASLSSKLSGEVKVVYVKAGDHVKKGQVLVQLDGNVAQMQYNQALASESMAQASLNKAKSSESTQALNLAKTQLKEAETNYKAVQKDAERSKTLYESDYIAKVEFEESQKQLDLARQKYEAAKENVELLSSKSIPEGIKVAQAQLDQANASAGVAKAGLDDAQIRSPIDGVVTWANINLGETLSTSSPCIEISNLTKMNSEFEIPEKYIAAISEGQTMQLNVEVLKEKTFSAKVITVNLGVENTTKTYKATLELTGDTEGIKSGMTARAKIPFAEKRQVILVSNKALYFENGLSYVFVIKDNKAEKRLIEYGLNDEKNTEILTGVTEGEVVALEGQQMLSDGDTVNCLPMK